MNIQKIERIAHDDMAGVRADVREPGWILYHGQRTGKIAVELARKLSSGVDPHLLYAAGLFHDIGKGDQSHNESGAKKTAKLLVGVVAPAKLDEVCDAIRMHNQRKQSDSFSDCVKLIQDADLIDHVGLIQVWLSFYWSGSHGQSIDDHLAFCDGEERKNWREYMRTHLNFDVSRLILEQRLRVEDEFLSSFRKVYFDGI